MRTAIGVLILLVAVPTVGCQKTQPQTAQPVAVPVETLLANPATYGHRLVRVHGCFVTGFERQTLQPCQSMQADHLIWVDNPTIVHSLHGLSLPGLPNATPMELAAPAQSPFVFVYSEAKINAAWEKLEAASSRSPGMVEITAVGQFETMAGRPTRGGFGHLGQYAHEFLLTDLIDSRGLPSKLTLSDSDYVVYSVFLSHELGTGGDLRVGDKGSVIAPYTVSYDSATPHSWDIPFDRIPPDYEALMKRQLKGLEEDTLRAFASCAAESLRVQPLFSLPVAYRIAAVEEVGDIEKLYRAYPKTRGYLQLSCVGMNAARDQALFYVQRLASQGNVGLFILMQQSRSGDRDWMIRGKMERWIG